VNDLSRRVPALLRRARALLGLGGGPDDRLGPSELPRAARAVQKLHEGLVGDRPLAHASTYERPAHLGAYLLWWWPQSYAKLRAILEMAAQVRGVTWTSEGPATPHILDLGAGPGPAAAAALDALGGSALAVDASPAALSEARALSEGAVETLRADLAKGLPALDGHFDFVLLCNALSELRGDAAALLGALPLARGAQIVLVEPALRETGRALLELRDRLLSSGSFRAVVPCFTQKPCPALAHPRDWCTTDRSWDPPLHLSQLARELGLRADEKLSFAPLVLARSAQPAGDELWRVVGVPPQEKGKKRLFVCNDEGRFPVARLDRDQGARNADFGRLERGDVVRLRGLGRRGDGLRVGPDSGVERP
jgi:SAM-dependent methyltransferase